MDEPGDVTRAWREVESRLPDGWRLDGIRCTSTGLGVDERGDAWRALGVGPEGQSIDAVGHDAVTALQNLARRIGQTERTNGSRSTTR